VKPVLILNTRLSTRNKTGIESIEIARTKKIVFAIVNSRLFLMLPNLELMNSKTQKKYPYVRHNMKPILIMRLKKLLDVIEIGKNKSTVKITKTSQCFKPKILFTTIFMVILS
jgi:hypothetical protein